MRFNNVLSAVSLCLLVVAWTDYNKACGSAQNRVLRYEGNKPEWDFVQLVTNNGKCYELKHVNPFDSMTINKYCTCKLYKNPGCTDEPKVVQGDGSRGGTDLNGKDADYGYTICDYVNGKAPE